jgi:hypothetical protein
LRRDLEAYLRDRRRASLRFFRGVAARPEVASLLDEVEAVVQRRREQHPTGEREAFDRMTRMRTLPFAEERARQIAEGLGLPEDTPLQPERPRHRKGCGSALAVH